jgi:hypothetical protein
LSLDQDLLALIQGATPSEKMCAVCHLIKTHEMGDAIAQAFAAGVSAEKFYRLAKKHNLVRGFGPNAHKVIGRDAWLDHRATCLASGPTHLVVQ